MTDKHMNQWLLEDGPSVLKDLGLKKGMNVLDFGCRHGTYTIPASVVVGINGNVVALDKDKSALIELQQRKKFNLKNIFCIQGDETTLHCFSSQMFNIILLFDVIHLIKNRKEFFKILHFVLTEKGFLIVYPRHHNEKMQLNLSEVIQEINKEGFQHALTYEGHIMHDDSLLSDNILVFSRR